MGYNYDPAKVSGDPTYHAPGYPQHPTIVGPGGKTTNIENNEKGILETSLAGVIVAHQQAELGSDHDSFKQGIYTTNSVGDND